MLVRSIETASCIAPLIPYMQCSLMISRKAITIAMTPTVLVNPKKARQPALAIRRPLKKTKNQKCRVLKCLAANSCNVKNLQIFDSTILGPKECFIVTP